MSTSACVPGFLPSTHGFHFANRWPEQPDWSIPFPTGAIDIGNAANGLCGGMAFAVRDFFEEGRPVPPTTQNPALHTPLYDYIARRLFDSFDVPAGVALFYHWQLPTVDQWKQMVLTEWPVIRKEIDEGRLVCLGLIRTQSFWPGDLGRNHQVLAHGYDVDDDGVVALHIADSNHPDADDVRLTFSTDLRGSWDTRYHVGGTEIAPGTPEGTFGAFVQRYTHCSPDAALDTPLAPAPVVRVDVPVTAAHLATR